MKLRLLHVTILLYQHGFILGTKVIYTQGAVMNFKLQRGATTLTRLKHTQCYWPRRCAGDAVFQCVVLGRRFKSQNNFIQRQLIYLAYFFIRLLSQLFRTSLI